MTTAEKTLERMRRNPRDWRIEELKAIAERLGIVYRHRGTSHVTFKRSDGEQISVPAHKPINPAYIRAFVRFIEAEVQE